MPVRKIVGLICPIAGVVCLVVGYAMVRQWLALLGVLFVFLVWLFTWIWSSRWLPLAALALSVSLSAAGIFAGAPPALMILSAALSLAAWDLALMDLPHAEVSSTGRLSFLAYSHYKSLALAVALGLLAAMVGRMVRIQLPFGVMILLALLVLVSLERLWRTLGG